MAHASKNSPPEPTVQDLLQTDTGDVPDVLKDTSRVDLGAEPIPKEHYTSAEYLEKEKRALWSQVWQMACREEDIPEPGDAQIYDIADTSVIVARQADGSVKAFYNACLHRGRRLCNENKNYLQFRCPFHAFSWNPDGSVRNITNAWDFQHVDREKFSLPEAAIARWSGFIFVNFSDHPPDFASYLEGLDRDMETRGWDLGERRKQVYVRKHHPANWKVVLEAFIESFHVVATHPSAMSYIGDANTQYDVWPDRRHVTRMISPRGLHSPHIGPLSDEEVYRLAIAPLDPEGGKSATLADGEHPRAAIAAQRRSFLKDNMDIDAAVYSDSEMIDTIQYHLFPNLVFWAGLGSFLVYRFLPHGDDPDRSTMDIMFLVPESENTPRPIAKEPDMIGVDESHKKAPQLGGYADVFDEDMSNIGDVQKGLKTMRGEGPVLGAYQEMRIRRFHKTLSEYVEAKRK